MKARVAKPGTRSNRPVPSDKFCNARKSSGGLCRQPAGARTSHLGTGRCSRHGGRSSDATTKFGHYSQIKHDRIKDVLSGLATIEINTMDLEPEVNLLRGMVIDYVNRYDEFVEAVMAWYADPETNQRPRKIMDIQDAAGLVESISRVVQRMHQIQSTGAVSLETFKRVTEHMGVIVAKYVNDPLVLNRIEEDWMELALDAKPRTHTDTSSSGDE